jgi:hypothetical protein
MTGMAAGDGIETQLPPTQRMHPESVPEPPKVDSVFWPEPFFAVESAPPRRIRPPKIGQWPTFGLPMLVVLALVSAFFAWVSAEPFWLALGHGDRGTLTVTHCVGEGLAARCEGEFTATGFSVGKVELAGADNTEHSTGDRLPARMVSNDSRIAYVGDVGGLHLRWAIGFGFLLLCGAGIMWATGALRLRGPNRGIAIALSFGGPLILLLGNLALAW